MAVSSTPTLAGAVVRHDTPGQYDSASAPSCATGAADERADDRTRSATQPSISAESSPSAAAGSSLRLHRGCAVRETIHGGSSLTKRTGAIGRQSHREQVQCACRLVVGNDGRDPV